MKCKLFILSILFTATALFAKANETSPGTGEESKKTDLEGGVFHADTKKPLSNVIVTVYSSAKKEKVVYTDANGNYSFNELKAGIYKLVFEKEGFKKVTKDKITIRPDEGCLMNIEMNNEERFDIVPGTFFDFN